jgi:RNA polymerase sigma-70 factor (ECF subfamily)
MTTNRPDDHPERWQELLQLLRPFHESAALTARRLARSPDDGDDLLSEAILRAFEKLSSLRDRDRFRPWFFAVLLSVHRNRARRHFWKRFLPLPEGKPGLEPVGVDGARQAELARRADRARRALDTLNAEQREAIVLFELQGFTIEEIAEMSNVGISAVKSRLARGRERLRQQYERWEEHVETSRNERAAGRPVGGSEHRKHELRGTRLLAD